MTQQTETEILSRIENIDKVIAFESKRPHNRRNKILILNGLSCQKEMLLNALEIMRLEEEKDEEIPDESEKDLF